MAAHREDGCRDLHERRPERDSTGVAVRKISYECSGLTLQVLREVDQTLGYKDDLRCAHIEAHVKHVGGIAWCHGLAHGQRV